jgi:long-subunit acyl-CoA synthetase (AMP-forming)
VVAAAEACTEAGISRILLLEKPACPDAKYQSIWDFAGEDEFEPEPVNGDEAESTVALLCYSSGTSGKPKVRFLVLGI